MLAEAVFIKSEPRERRDDVVIPEQPSVYNEDCRKQSGISDNKPTRQQGDGENSKNVTESKEIPRNQPIWRLLMAIELATIDCVAEQQMCRVTSRDVADCWTQSVP